LGSSPERLLSFQESQSVESRLGIGGTLVSKQRGADIEICHFISIFFLFTEATVVLFIRSHLSKVLPWRTSSAIICISFTVCFFKQCLHKLQSGFGEKRFAVASGN
jgi:hypothetical protein